MMQPEIRKFKKGDIVKIQPSFQDKVLIGFEN
jgi:hypothetical protein